MLVDRLKVIADLRDNLYHKYVHYIPELKSLFDQINGNPSNIFAESKFHEIAEFPGIKQRLHIIYGADADIQLKRKKSKIKRHTETFLVDEETYEEWFKFFMNQPNININFFNVCYNSNKNKYLVSTVYMEM